MLGPKPEDPSDLSPPDELSQALSIWARHSASAASRGAQAAAYARTQATIAHHMAYQAAQKIRELDDNECVVKYSEEFERPKEPSLSSLALPVPWPIWKPVSLTRRSNTCRLTTFLFKPFLLCHEDGGLPARLVGESDVRSWLPAEEMMFELDRQDGDELCDEVSSKQNDCATWDFDGFAGQVVDIKSRFSGRAVHRGCRVRLTTHRLLWRAVGHNSWLALRLDAVEHLESWGGVLRSLRCMLKLSSGVPVYVKTSSEPVTQDLLLEISNAVAQGQCSSWLALLMVCLAITADCWDSVWKVKRQLEDLDIPEQGSVEINSDGKIFLETSVKVLLERVVCLSMVERVFLCLHREELHEQHELCKNGPNYALLQDWVYNVDWDAAFRVIDQLHCERPSTWMLDSKRHGSKGSPTRAFDRLVMQQKVRDVLHEILPQFGCQHDPRATLMVYVFISATLGFIGVPLLHRRVKQGYFPHKGLHHSLCWGLAATAALKLVLDPMAGKGVVLLEAAAFWPWCKFLGLELDQQQLACAKENLRYAGERGVLPFAQSIGFARADCARLPLSPGSVDVVLCDLPYGRQYGTEAANHQLYALALLEIARVLKPTGRAVLITAATDSNDSAMKAAIAAAELEMVRRLGFKFGGNRDRLRCAMYCLAGKTASLASYGDMFDWTCVQRMETLAGSEDLVWKAAKPVLQVYVPLKACDASGQVRERVHSAKVDQGCESSEKALGREADRADRHKQNILTGLRDKLFDELSLPCFFYVARSLHSTPADRFSPHL
eukprot:symbB.v1.2.033773.t1/scaffold4244.1/size42487/1